MSSAGFENHATRRSPCQIFVTGKIATGKITFQKKKLSIIATTTPKHRTKSLFTNKFTTILIYILVCVVKYIYYNESSLILGCASVLTMHYVFVFCSPCRGFRRISAMSLAADTCSVYDRNLVYDLMRSYMRYESCCKMHGAPRRATTATSFLLMASSVSVFVCLLGISVLRERMQDYLELVHQRIFTHPRCS